MKVNHKWKAQEQAKPPKFVPYEQYEAALKIMQNNSYDFAVQLMGDLAVLAVHEAYGFRTEHMKKFRDALGKELERFSENVDWEFRAETQGMSCRERKAARPDLDYTMEQMDARLREIIPDIENFQQRYGGFGGRLSWARKDG